MPRNAITGAAYRGVNVLTLTLSPLAFASGDPRWATYKQAAERGWQVRKGSRGTTAYFFKRLEVASNSRDDAADEETAVRRIPLLRAFTLFHASQIDGVPDDTPPTLEEAPWRAPEAVEIVVANSGIAIREGGDRAFYSPHGDFVQMPVRSSFRSAEAWASVIVHEISHASSAPSRLNRDIRNRFGSDGYAREELVAELAQMMACGELGVADCEFTNGVSYLSSWIAALRTDRKEIFRAAAEAQRVADWLLNFHPDYAAKHKPGTNASLEDDAPSSAPAPSEFAEAA